MADTYGLMASRQKWIDEVAEGNTDMTHKDWYEAQVKAGNEALWKKVKEDRKKPEQQAMASVQK